MGQTRVDLQHLLEDLRDAYPGALEETILTEIVANSLDSGATRLTFATDPASTTLTVVDDGSGMARRALARYHDIASSTKTRGEGIGFAGVGIKLGLLACAEVLTETRRGDVAVATSWRLATRQRAPWSWVPPSGLVAEHGTAVRLRLKNPLSPLLEGGFLEAVLLRHFQPLLEPSFAELLRDHYPSGIVFTVNGHALTAGESLGDRIPLLFRLGRRRKPSGIGYLVRSPEPVPEDQRGLAISTLGKVIKRGWDWLGVVPAEVDLVSGVVEVPALAESLTLNKADFIRSGPRGMLYLAHRKVLQEAVSVHLASWGEAREPEAEARRRKTRPLERDLQSVLGDLAEDFPLIATLVERRPGGQKRLPLGQPGFGVEPVPGSGGTGTHEATAGAEPAPEPSEPTLEVEGAVPAEGASAGEPPPEATPPSEPTTGTGGVWPGKPGRRRPARYGLSIQFESRPDDPALGRLIESTVWVNEAHPAYTRAVASRSEGYHVAVTVALALAPLAVEPAETQAFLSAFLARWGEALGKPSGSRTTRRQPARGPSRG